MGDSMSAMYDDIAKEKYWRENLKDGKLKIQDVSEVLKNVMDTEAFTKTEFDDLKKALDLLYTVTKYNKYW
tara:strand:- start:1126 stop:1338 length:213 start_codon:yes stop_codon:yes gene_type:complete